MDTTQKTPSPRSAPNTGARRAAWRILQREGRRLEETPLRTLLENPGRPAQLRLEAAGLVADFSKQRIDGKIQDASQILAHLSEREDLSDKAEDLLAELRERIDQGNTDLAQRIIQTNEKQDWSQGFLDDTLEQAFGALLAENSVKQQQARIMLGTIK